jgi:hypothetical protein
MVAAAKVTVSWDPCPIVLQIFTHVLKECVAPMLRMEGHVLFPVPLSPSKYNLVQGPLTFLRYIVKILTVLLNNNNFPTMKIAAACDSQDAH